MLTALLWGAALAGSESWELAEASWWVDDDAVVREQLSTWELLEGSYVFRIDEGDRPVGVVVVGEGTWHVHFDRTRDARATANRRVATEADPSEPLRRVAEGEAPLSLPVDRGLVLGLDVWHELEPSLLQVQMQSGVLLGEVNGVEEVLVTAHRLNEARRTAEHVLRTRTEWMRGVNFDPASLLTADAWRGPSDAPARMVEMRTDRAWDRFAGATDVRTDERWLTWMQDPAGWVTPAASEVVLARTDDEGRPRQWALTWARRAPVDGRRVPAERVDLVGAGASLVFAAEGTGASVQTTTMMDVQLRAVGGPASVVVFDVPHVEQQGFLSNAPLPHSFSVLGVRVVDGPELQPLHLPLTGDQREHRGAWRTYAVQLPEPLPAGQVVTLRVSWKDSRRLAHQLALDNGVYTYKRKTALYDLGATTDLVPVSLRVRGSHPRPVPLALRVGVPEPLLGYEVAMSGAQGESEVHGAHRWTHSATDTGAPVVALGRWQQALEPAVEDLGMPAVRTLLRDLEPRDVPVTVRQLTHLAQSVFPPLSAAEVEVVELYDLEDRPANLFAGGGVLAMHPWSRRTIRASAETGFRNRFPHYEFRTLATSLFSHYWLDLGMEHSPPGMGAAGAWGIWVVGTAHGPEAEAAWWDIVHQLAAPSDGRTSLLGGPDASWDSTFFVGRTLAAEVGQPKVMEALAAVIRGTYPPTWEGLRAALENVARRDLSHVFEVWVDAGLAPRVDATLEAGDEGVVVALTSDIAFGTVRIPVEVRGPDRARWSGVAEVVDGVGRLDVPWPHDGSPRRVVVDPERTLLLRRLD